MDGLQWENPIKMDDLGGKPPIFSSEIHVLSIPTELPSLKLR